MPFVWTLDPLRRAQSRSEVSTKPCFVQKAWVKDSSQVTQARALPKQESAQKYNGAARVDTKSALARVRNRSCVPPKKKGAV